MAVSCSDPGAKARYGGGVMATLPGEMHISARGIMHSACTVAEAGVGMMGALCRGPDNQSVMTRGHKT